MAVNGSSGAAPPPAAASSQPDASKAADDSLRANLQVLSGPQGTDKVYCLPAERPTGAVVFFVGDQLEAMGLPTRVLELQEPRRQAAIMAARFPGASVAVVMPSRLEACFACFDHFCGRLTASGEPLGYCGQEYRAASQLAALLQNGGLWAPPPQRPPVPAFDAPAAAPAAPGPSQGSTGQCAPPQRLPVRLVGFSKGGTVLNQVLAELAAAAEARAGGGSGRPLSGGAGPPPPPMDAAAFLTAVSELHFLDVGLNCRGAYITDPQITSSLGAGRAPKVFLHGTPRQWDDPTRPWIGREEQRFEELLRSAGVPLARHKYFADELPSLTMHFEVIDAMDTRI